MAITLSREAYLEFRCFGVADQYSPARGREPEGLPMSVAAQELLLAARDVRIEAAADKTPAVNILAYSGDLMVVPGWHRWSSTCVTYGRWRCEGRRGIRPLPGRSPVWHEWNRGLLAQEVERSPTWRSFPDSAPFGCGLAALGAGSRKVREDQHLQLVHTA